MTHFSSKWLERSRRVLPFALGSMLLSASAWLPVAAQISQIPLLTQKGSVEPNLVFMFDDSASMPSGTVYQYGGTEGTQGRSGPSTDTYAAYSPDINRIYYDPRTRYLPRVNSDGVTYQTAGATNKYITDQSNSPPTTSTSGTYTIKVYFAKPYGVSGTGIDVNGAYTTTSVNLIGAYYTTFYTPLTGEVVSGSTATYPNTNTGTQTTLPRFVNRSDCVASPTSCSWDEEKQNYGNWVAYHYNRLEMVKTGVGLAFRDVLNTIRLGWGRINQIDFISPASGAASLDSGVALFNQSRKDAFYTWLYLRTGSVTSTPNRGALQGVGEYYKRADNWGPWADYPNPLSSTVGTGTVSGSFISYVRPDSTYPTGQKTITVTDNAITDRGKHATCRRSYSMLVTDGYYNDSTGYETSSLKVGEVDNVALASAITGCTATNTNCASAPDLTFSYAAGTKPYAQSGSSNTLADIAQKYWVTDLRTDLLNKVKKIDATGARDANGVPMGNESFWQNMTFYAVGLGVFGTLKENSTTFDALKAGTTSWPTITFSSTGDETTIDDMWHATINSRGRLLSARNSTELSDGVEGMLADINRDTSSQSGVAASTVSLVSSTKKYTPSYTTGSWTGNVTSTELDNSGAEQCINWKAVGSATSTGTPSANPYIPPTCSGTNVTYTGIPAHGSRNIYAWNGSAFGLFNSSNVHVTANVAPSVVGSAKTDLINFLRGDQSNEDTTTVMKSYRLREYLLGDVVNSTPSFIQAALDMKYDKLPSATYGQSAYKAFLKTKMRPCTLSIVTDCDATGLRPEGVLFAGANDGMLHGFRDSTGAEAFAFVPRAVMPNMHLLASRSYNHNYYVDGPTVEADACLTGGTACTTWSNLLLGTLGAGGKEVYALDVTTLTPGTTMGLSASSIKWEITTATANFANLGNILTEVQTGLTMSGHWVAVFGNGYYGADGKAYLYVVDLTTGLLVSGSNPIATNAATSNGLGGVRLVYNDNEYDRRIVGAYAGDLKGNMWKFDLKDTNPAQWKLGINGAALFTATASPTQPITAAPTVVAHPTSGVVVAFGTGKLFDASPDDFGNTNVQSLYGVWDTVPFGSPTTGSTLSGTNTVGSTLVLQTISAAVSGLNVVSSAAGEKSTSTVNYYSVSTNAIDWTSNRGWYINLTNLGQRVIYSLETLIGRYAAVDTISPSNLSIDPCTTAGTAKAWNYVIDMVTGGGTKEAIYDTNGDGVVDASDAIVSGYENSADGRTRYLKNAIVSTSDADWGYGSTGKGGTTGGSIVFVGLSTQQLPQTKINVAGSCIKDCTTPSGITKVVKRTWRQLFLR